MVFLCHDLFSQLNREILSLCRTRFCCFCRHKEKIGWCCIDLSCLDKWRTSLKVCAHGRSLTSTGIFRDTFSEFPEVFLKGLVNLCIECALKVKLVDLEILVLQTSVVCCFLQVVKLLGAICSVLLSSFLSSLPVSAPEKWG